MGAGLVSTGLAIDVSFNSVGASVAFDEVSYADMAGVAAGTIAGLFAATAVSGIVVAGVVGYGVKSYFEYVGSVTVDVLDFVMNFEDPDGGFNGSGLVSHDYGSGYVPIGYYDDSGRGVGIRIGYEFSTLDEIAYANQHTIDGPRYGYVMIDGTRTYVDLRAYAAQNGQDALDTAVRAAENWNPPASGGGGSGGGSAGSHSPSGGGVNPSTGQVDAPPGTGGSGSETNHSLGSPTGYSDRGVYDVEGPEAGAAGAPSGTYHSYEHYSDLGNGSTAVTGLPVILDLDGDGVEIAVNAQISFDWDGDTFLESGNWAAAEGGFWVVDPEAANLPTALLRNAA